MKEKAILKGCKFVFFVFFFWGGGSGRKISYAEPIYQIKKSIKNYNKKFSDFSLIYQPPPPAPPQIFSRFI